MTLSVVIPTHNRRRSLDRLLTVLRADAAVDEIVVVDDGSEPPVIIHDPEVIVYRNEIPRLVSAARNEGAFKSSGDFILFIDDDCLPSEAAVDRLKQVLERDENVGIAGPTIVYGSDPKTVWCAGVTHDKLTGRTRLRARGEPLHSVVSLSPRCDDFPSAFAVRRACFEAVRGFDEEGFPIMLEESDLAARVRSLGYSVELVRNAVVVHDIEVKSSLARLLHMTSPQFAYLMARGRGRFIRRHSPPFLRILRMAFWLVVLVPVYTLAAVKERGSDRKLRITMVGSLLRGAFEGAVGRWE